MRRETDHQQQRPPQPQQQQQVQQQQSPAVTTPMTAASPPLSDAGLGSTLLRKTSGGTGSSSSTSKRVPSFTLTPTDGQQQQQLLPGPHVINTVQRSPNAKALRRISSDRVGANAGADEASAGTPTAPHYRSGRATVTHGSVASEMSHSGGALLGAGTSSAATTTSLCLRRSWGSKHGSDCSTYADQRAIDESLDSNSTSGMNDAITTNTVLAGCLTRDFLSSDAGAKISQFLSTLSSASAEQTLSEFAFYILQQQLPQVISPGSLPLSGGGAAAAAAAASQTTSPPRASSSRRSDLPLPHNSGAFPITTMSSLTAQLSHFDGKATAVAVADAAVQVDLVVSLGTTLRENSSSATFAQTHTGSSPTSAQGEAQKPDQMLERSPLASSVAGEVCFSSDGSRSNHNNPNLNNSNIKNPQSTAAHRLAAMRQTHGVSMDDFGEVESASTNAGSDDEHGEHGEQHLEEDERNEATVAGSPREPDQLSPAQRGLKTSPMTNFAPVPDRQLDAGDGPNSLENSGANHQTQTLPVEGDSGGNIISGHHSGNSTFRKKRRRSHAANVDLDGVEAVPAEEQEVAINSYRKIGDYILTMMIGEGATSSVWHAIQISDPTQVFAIKVVRKNRLLNRRQPKSSQHVTDPKIRKEIAIMRSLNQNRNVVQFYEALQCPVNIYLRMQLASCHLFDIDEVSGICTSQAMEFNERDAMRFFGHVADAVQNMNNQGLIHRDIKPHNILFLKAERRALLADFGISEVVQEATGGAFMGTPSFLPPDILLREAPDSAPVNDSRDADERAAEAAERTAEKAVAAAAAAAKATAALHHGRGGGEDDNNNNNNNNEEGPRVASFSSTSVASSGALRDESPGPHDPSLLQETISGEFVAASAADVTDADEEAERLQREKKKIASQLHKQDAWSLGVLLYCMVYGRHPFDLQNLHYSVICPPHLPEHAADGQVVSELCRTLIENMLHLDPNERWSARRALLHIRTSRRSKSQSNLSPRRQSHDDGMSPIFGGLPAISTMSTLALPSALAVNHNHSPSGAAGPRAMISPFVQNMQPLQHPDEQQRGGGAGAGGESTLPEVSPLLMSRPPPVVEGSDLTATGGSASPLVYSHNAPHNFETSLSNASFYMCLSPDEMGLISAGLGPLAVSRQLEEEVLAEVQPERVSMYLGALQNNSGGAEGMMARNSNNATASGPGALESLVAAAASARATAASVVRRHSNASDLSGSASTGEGAEVVSMMPRALKPVGLEEKSGGDKSNSK